MFLLFPCVEFGGIVVITLFMNEFALLYEWMLSIVYFLVLFLLKCNTVVKKKRKELNDMNVCVVRG